MPEPNWRFAWPVRVQKGTDEPTLRFARAGRHFVRKLLFYDGARAELAICVAGARPEGDGRANLTISTRRPSFHAKTFILRRCQSRIGDLSGQCEEKRKKAEGPQFGWLPHLRHRPSGALTPDMNNYEPTSSSELSVPVSQHGKFISGLSVDKTQCPKSADKGAPAQDCPCQ